jgi:RNA polymerase sigma-70 factor (ECF subfamily)
MKRGVERDLRLARGACAGEEAAWSELVDELGPRIYAIALHFVHDRTRAEDLTQDVFMKLHQNLHKYNGKVPLAGWTLRVARNLCIDHYRRHRIETASTLSSPEILEQVAARDNPARHAQQRQLLAQADEALAAMDPQVALIIRLRDLEGLTYEEIATLTGLRLGTVKSKLHRGRKELFATLRVKWRRDEASGAPEEPDSALEIATC